MVPVSDTDFITNNDATTESFNLGLTLRVIDKSTNCSELVSSTVVYHYLPDKPGIIIDEDTIKCDIDATRYQ